METLYKDGNLKDPVTSGRIVEGTSLPARKTACCHTLDKGWQEKSKLNH